MLYGQLSNKIDKIKAIEYGRIMKCVACKNLKFDSNLLLNL